MEFEPTFFPFSRLSPSLCVLKLVPLSIYLCTTDNSGARVESQQGNPLTGQSGPREQSRHDDKDEDKRAKFFEDKKRERERR